MVIFDQVDKTNRTAFEYFKQYQEKISQICQPLWDNLKIEGFSYFHLLPNGYGISLSNQPEVNETYYEYLSKEGALYPDEFKKTSLERTHYFIWSRLEPLRGYNFPIATGVNIYRRDCAHYEGFVFYKNGISKEYESLFLNELKCLEMFGECFKIQVRELIEMNDSRKLVWTNINNRLGPYEDASLFNQNKLQKFIEAIKPNRLPIRNHAGSEILLTERETQCIVMICEGRRAKEIGQELGLSPRTVEKYIERIKQKCGYSLNSEIIKALRKNPVIWI